MYSIYIWVRCSGRFSEVLPEELENAEFAVEEFVSQALLEFFRTVIVERVVIKYLPPGQEDAGDELPQSA